MHFFKLIHIGGAMTWGDLRGFLKIMQLYAPSAYLHFVKLMLALRTPRDAGRNAIPLLRETLKELTASKIDFKDVFPRHHIVLKYIELLQQDFQNQGVPFLMQLYALIKKNIYRDESPAATPLNEETLLVYLDFITISLKSEVETEMSWYKHKQEHKHLVTKAEQLSAEKSELEERLFHSSATEAAASSSSVKDRPASPATTARNLIRLSTIFDKMGAALGDMRESLSAAMDSFLATQPVDDCESDPKLSSS